MCTPHTHTHKHAWKTDFKHRRVSEERRVCIWFDLFAICRRTISQPGKLVHSVCMGLIWILGRRQADDDTKKEERADDSLDCAVSTHRRKGLSPLRSSAQEFSFALSHSKLCLCCRAQCPGDLSLSLSHTNFPEVRGGWWMCENYSVHRSRGVSTANYEFPIAHNLHITLDTQQRKNNEHKLKKKKRSFIQNLY